MKDQIIQLIKLKQVQASLLKEVKELDLIIDSLLLKDKKARDYIANQETIGFFEYALYKKNDDKVRFALAKLGSSTKSSLIKYLNILEDGMNKIDLDNLVKDGLEILLNKKLIIEKKTNAEPLFIIKKMKPF